ncbi:MAG: GGDEF domain-containing protein [Lachnospiraceae bacterium]|nr:GGDEF domain-containing protein [Lachnospiraceae bacterium]
MEYIIYFDIAAIAVMMVLIIAFFLGRYLQTYQNDRLIRLFWMNLITAISDLIATITQDPSYPGNLLIQTVFHQVYFIAHPACLWLFYLYCNTFSKHERSQAVETRILLSVPFALTTLISLTNPLHEMLFTIDADYLYHRGPLTYVFYASAVFYTILCLNCIQFAKSGINKKLKYCTFAFLVMMITSVFVQYIFPELLIESFAAALVLLIIYITLERPGEFIETELGVMNSGGLRMVLESLYTMKEPFALIVIKFHGIRMIRETFGEEYLRDLYQQIMRFINQNYKKLYVFHYSQSTFAIVMTDYEEAEFMKIAIELEREFNGEWAVGESITHLTATVGYALCPKELRTIADVDDFINVLRLSVRGEDKTLLAPDQVDMDWIIRKRNIERIVKDAIGTDRFQVYYQPIIDAKTDRIISAEALVRLQSEELGDISPEEFIPIAEEQGNIIWIGEHVFRSVCRMISANNLYKKGVEYIEINLSTVQCLQSNLSERLMSIIKETQILPQYISLEITETARAVFNKTFSDNIDSLSKNGFSFAIDDYGSGNSNLNYLLHLPFNVLKIDKNILWDAFRESTAMIVLESTISLAHQLGLKIVAEGVEEARHVEKLKELSCDFFQGFYFSKPLPEKEFIKLLNEQSKKSKR